MLLLIFLRIKLTEKRNCITKIAELSLTHIPGTCFLRGKHNNTEFILSDEPAQEEVVEPIDEEGKDLFFNIEKW